MKILILILLFNFSAVISAGENQENLYNYQAQEQAFQKFMNKGSSNSGLQNLFQERLNFIIPIRFCDERTACTSNLQCGFDGVCGLPIGNHRRCVCY